jgi:hypothetical protein
MPAACVTCLINHFSSVHITFGIAARKLSENLAARRRREVRGWVRIIDFSNKTEISRLKQPKTLSFTLRKLLQLQTSA